MATAKPLKMELMRAKSREKSPLTDDRMIYDELIAPLEATMMRSIWRIVRNADVAEDCLQEALAVIWKKRSKICRHPNPRALILKICLETACDSLRRLAPARRHVDLSQLLDAPASSDHDANQGLEALELQEHVQQAIRRLPRKRALAVMMRLIQEEPYDVIAHSLNCSEVTARIHISKGCIQLRKWLSPLYRNPRRERGQ